MIGYTTIEQSKKLVELGIDVDTADMHYDEYDVNVDNLPEKGIEVFPTVNKHKNAEYKLPCWSTEALLKLLPREINRTDNYILDNILVYPNKGYCISYRNLSNYENKEQIMSVSDTLLECAYEMIVKLKEKGIL